MTALFEAAKSMTPETREALTTGVSTRRALTSVNVRSYKYTAKIRMYSYFLMKYDPSPDYR